MFNIVEQHLFNNVQQCLTTVLMITNDIITSPLLSHTKQQRIPVILWIFEVRSDNN